MLPWWNDHAGDYVTSYRCGACFPTSIAGTRAALDGLDDGHRTKLVAFVRRHGLDDVARRAERGTPADAEPILRELLDQIERGEIRLEM